MMQHKNKIPIKPPRLTAGDVIGIVAPSSPFDEEPFNRGIAVLKSMGFHTVIPEGLAARKGYLAGTDAHRARLINRFFAQKEIKAIFCARGGFGSMKILPFLDYKLIHKQPKIFVGFSDISALLSALHKQCNLVCFHGPTVTGLAAAARETKKSLLLSLTTATTAKIGTKKGLIIQSGVASGPVVGGNLTTLCHLIGTPYAPELKGKILIIEDKGEAPYRIDRMLSQLTLAGCFEGMKGLLIGSFEDCGKAEDIYRVVRETFHHTGIPVLAGVDIGHGKTNMTVPIGLTATLDTDRRQLIFHEPAVR